MSAPDPSPGAIIAASDKHISDAIAEIGYSGLIVDSDVAAELRACLEVLIKKVLEVRDGLSKSP